MADKGDSSRTAAMLEDFVTSLRRRCGLCAPPHSERQSTAACVLAPAQRCCCAPLPLPALLLHARG
jgi:hypothetical protein